MITAVRYRHFTLVVVVAVVLFTPAVRAAGSDRDDERIRYIQHDLLPPVLVAGEPLQGTEIADRMAKLHVPGVSIAVIHDGKLDWARGFGVAQIGGPAVTPATLFQACSISKPVSATAILHLVGQGKLDLDKDVNAYLKSWKLPSNAFTDKVHVTLRELLNHTAGITVSGFPGYLPGTQLPTLTQMLDGEPPANSPPIRVDMVPGIGYRYSGGGYLVAQQVVEDTTHRPFADVVRDTVLRPLGMGASVYEQPLSTSRAREATTPYDENGEPMAGGTRVYPEIAPAGLWTTPTDLARWAIEIQRALSGRSTKILLKSMVREMLTPGLESWGLGIDVGGSPEHPYFTHSGVGAGFRTYLLAYNRGDGVIVMTNGTNGTVLRNDIVRTVAEKYNWPDFRPAVHHISSVGSHDTSAIVGAYQLYRYTFVKLTQEGDRLFFQRSGQGKLELFPEGHDRYFFRVVDAQIMFDFDPLGRPRGFTVLQNGHLERATAVDESDIATVNKSLAQRLRDKTPDPQSEPTLRRYIEYLRSASVDYGQLSVPIAQMTRQRLSEFTSLVVHLGKIEAVSFKGVAPNGADIFDVRFDNGLMEWRIVPTERGAVDDIGFHFHITGLG
jgi:CubicO group peptidase (beta-lactamase class C family)